MKLIGQKNMQDSLIDAIYEAAITADGWPNLLARLAAHVDARSGVLFTSGYDEDRWAVSPGMERTFLEFVGGGWHLHDDRVRRLVESDHPGFRTDADLMGLEALHREKVYTGFLIPHGFAARAATVMPPLAGDGRMILSVGGFASHAASQLAVPALDSLRPHLARAAMLAVQFRLEQARGAVQALEMAGVPAAVLGSGRRLLAANTLFDGQLAGLGSDGPGGLVLRDEAADARLGEALAALARPGGQGASLPVRHAEPALRAALHVLPLRGLARDLMLGASALIMISRLTERPPIAVQLIQWLLDLTPSEARLARDLAAGKTLAQAAQDGGVAASTARTHLKNIFYKTGLSRQSDLVALLAGIPAPIL